jgi:hypothetical protein
MKSYILVGLVAAQMITIAEPAAAARPEETATLQTGTFAGARIRLSLGGKQQDRRFRAGLAIAPMQRSQAISGESRTRIGEGLELGFAGERPLTLSLAGRPVNHLLPSGSKADDEPRLGMSTGGYVAIGVGVAALVGTFVLYDHYRDADAASD